jgi:hypothetical protein
VACWTLETLLAPYEGTFFLEEVLGQSALYVPGDPDKFRGLFSWNALNHLMKFGGMGHPRLRLISDGRELHPESYLRSGVSGYPRPLVQEINSALRDGAILAVESIEELHEPISRLCEVLERRIEVHMQADIYACWHDQAPSALRWNQHDVFVLQVEGTKQWRIYCPTASRPAADRPPPDPAGDPAWEGVLRPGSLLYVPKGWWYCDQTAEPALCIAARFRNPSGVDVLQRIFDQLARSNEIQADCPRFGGIEGQSAFIRALQSEVGSACTSAGLLLGFLKDCRALSEPRVGFSFPWSAARVPLPPSEDFVGLPLLRFPRADSVRQLPNEDAVEIPVNGRSIRFDEDAGKIFARVCVTPSLSVGALVRAFEGEMSRERILASLSELAGHGVVELLESGPLGHT